MATITQRFSKNGRKSYFVQVRLRGHPSISMTFERRTDAKEWEARTESQIKEGRRFPGRVARRHLLGDAIDRYVTEIIPQKPCSGPRQVQQLLWWKAWLGHQLMAELTPQVLGEARDALARDVIGDGRLRSP